jgi:putative transposase
VINVGNTSIGLLSENEKMAELPITEFDRLVRKKRIHMVPDDPRRAFEANVMERLSKASESDLRTANYRAGLVHRYLHDRSLPARTDTSPRTFLRWIAGYRQAQADSGSGYLGLLPHHSTKGNRTPRLSEAVRRTMTEVLEHDYETKKQKTFYSSWIKLKFCCEKKGIVAPSYKTFTIAAGQRDPYRQRLKRKATVAPTSWSRSIGNLI